MRTIKSAIVGIRSRDILHRTLPRRLRVALQLPLGLASVATWRISPASRPSVIFRKVTNGFRSVWGSAVYADICSALATGALHGHTALSAIKACLAGRSVLNST